jgi:hypothetical protein
LSVAQPTKTLILNTEASPSAALRTSGVPEMSGVFMSEI